MVCYEEIGRGFFISSAVIRRMTFNAKPIIWGGWQVVVHSVVQKASFVPLPFVLSPLMPSLSTAQHRGRKIVARVNSVVDWMQILILFLLVLSKGSGEGELW